MKKIISILCVLFSLCMIFAACTPTQNEGTPGPATEQPTEQPTEEPTEQPTEKPTEQPTEQPTEDPSVQEPVNPFAPTRADLDEHDYNAVRSFLEIEDENGVKNGEKLSAENGLVYDPDDPGTWSEYKEYNPNPSNDIRFKGSNFSWNEDGKLLSVRFDFQFSTHGTLVGELDLSGCSELFVVRMYFVGISEIDVSGSDSAELEILCCPEIERIISRNTPNRYLMVADCPKIQSISWIMMCTESLMHLNHPGSSEEVQHFFHDATVYADADGQGYVSIDWFKDSEHFGENLQYAVVATPYEGHEFLGWYDVFGHLISTDYQVIIQGEYYDYPNLVDLMGRTTVYVIAVFS